MVFLSQSWMGRDRGRGPILNGTQTLRQGPYVVVGAFVIGMLLTPPDVISQTLLAIPMLVLFELGIFFAQFTANKKQAVEETQE